MLNFTDAYLTTLTPEAGAAVLLFSLFCGDLIEGRFLLIKNDIPR